MWIYRLRYFRSVPQYAPPEYSHPSDAGSAVRACTQNQNHRCGYNPPVPDRYSPPQAASGQRCAVPSAFAAARSMLQIHQSCNLSLYFRLSHKAPCLPVLSDRKAGAPRSQSSSPAPSNQKESRAACGSSVHPD